MEVEGSQDHRKVGIGRLELDGHFVRAAGLRLVDLIGQDLGLGGSGRVLVTHEGEHHVGWRQRLSVMKLHALAQLEHPGGGVFGKDFLGQRGLRRQAAVERGQAVVGHVAANVVTLVGLFGWVQRIAYGGGGTRDPDAPAAAWGLRMGRPGEARNAAGQRGLHAASHQHREYVAPVGAALHRIHHAYAFLGADQGLQLRALVHGGSPG